MLSWAEQYYDWNQHKLSCKSFEWNDIWHSVSSPSGWSVLMCIVFQFWPFSITNKLSFYGDGAFGFEWRLRLTLAKVVQGWGISFHYSYTQGAGRNCWASLNCSGISIWPSFETKSFSSVESFRDGECLRKNFPTEENNLSVSARVN